MSQPRVSIHAGMVAIGCLGAMCLFTSCQTTGESSAPFSIINADGTTSSTGAVFPGRPDRYYALADGTVREVFPVIPTAERGGMVTIPFVLPSAQGSTALTPQAIAEIERVAGRIRKLDYCEVFIEGHTDALGEGNISRAGNTAWAEGFSRDRANAVAKWLRTNLGSRRYDSIAPSVLGIGFAVPVVIGGIDSDQAVNRRIVVRVIFPAKNRPVTGYGYAGQTLKTKGVDYAD